MRHNNTRETAAHPGRYELAAVGKPGSIIFEEQDVTSVETCSNGSAARISLRYRREYQEADVFEFEAGRYQIDLVARQVQQAARQAREWQEAGHKGFCTPCYDHGKGDRPLPGCVRCQLLEACRLSGQGDYRIEQRPDPPVRPGCGYAVGMAVLILVALAAIYTEGVVGREKEQVQQQLDACRKVQQFEKHTRPERAGR